MLRTKKSLRRLSGIFKMNDRCRAFGIKRAEKGILAFLFAAVLIALPGYAQNGDMPPAPQQGVEPGKFKTEELEQLAAPIALYPDALVAQVLMASTYPLEVVQAARWSKENPNLKDKELQDALQKQTWDASVKSLTAFPQILKMMNDQLDWTQKLGDAFLGQQKELMDAIQRLRAKAQAAGNLKSTKEQNVTTEQEGSTTIIKIEPAQPDVVYVPVYETTVVYGPWPYPAYPPYYYPPPPGYVAGAVFVGFTVGIAVGAAWGNCNWHSGDVNINVNNYNRFNNTNINNPDWRHNPDHRKGVEYRDQTSREKYGRGQGRGAESREAFRGRADEGRKEIAHGGADRIKDSGSRERDTGMRSGGGAFDGVDRGGDARNYSDRGAASRGGMGGASAGARGGGFHGGGRGGGGRR
jgi:hypothetical protein